MSTPIFPAAIAPLQDSKYFSFTLEDKTIKGETDGGYTHARPRHTRPPRRTFKTGFTEISQSQLKVLTDFYELVGGYTKFMYTDPTDNKTYTVRFSKPFSGKYQGIGPARLWNVTDIELIEA